MTTTYSSLDAVSTAIYSALNVASVTAQATGGIGDDIAQGTGYPFLLIVVSETPQGGFGTKPGNKQLPQVDIRLHAFSKYEGAREAQVVIDAAIGALFTAFDPTNPTVTVTGYNTCSLFHDSTSEPFDSLVAGLKVKEVVAQFRFFVEAQ